MRKLSILLIAIMTLCLLVACSSETKQSTEKTKEDSATNQSSEIRYPRCGDAFMPLASDEVFKTLTSFGYSSVELCDDVVVVKFDTGKVATCFKVNIVGTESRNTESLEVYTDCYGKNWNIVRKSDVNYVAFREGYTRLSAETGDISFDDGTVLIFKATDVVKCAYTWDGCENFFLAKEYVLNHLNYE